MIAAFLARRRLSRANAAFRSAYEASVKATDRQDCRAMHEAREALRKARNAQLAAEMAVAR